MSDTIPASSLVFSRARTQRIVGRQFSDVVEAVRWFGGTQAQDYNAAVWALGYRVAGANRQTIEAAIAQKKIVRSWPMRTTLHFMAAEDVRWMVQLMGQRHNRKLQSHFRKLGITSEYLERCRVVFEQFLAGKQAIRSELYAALELAGLDRVSERGNHCINYWAQEGLLCVGAHRGKQATIVLLDEWVPVSASRLMTEAEALREIALRYFMSHGPAALKDFVWWTGLTITEAKRAISLTEGMFVSCMIGTEEYFMTQETRAYLSDRFSEITALLMPPFDEYTIAYADRSAALGNESLNESRYGVFGPNLLLNGIIRGSWRKVERSAQLQLHIKPSRPLEGSEVTMAERAAEQYAAFHNRTAEVHWDD